MELIWQVLLQFLWRSGCGIALAMSITSTRVVPGGFFRVHLWVLLGMNTLPVLALLTGESSPFGTSRWPLGLALGAMVLSYVGSVLFLYEQVAAGKLLLWLLGGLLAALAIMHQAAFAHLTPAWAVADALSGSALLGTTLTAMLLGHYYLNAPGMQLAPLRTLIWLMVAAVLLRAAVGTAGLAAVLQHQPQWLSGWWVFLLVRYVPGFAAPLLLAAMTLRTLTIPNTQSATGILYAAVTVVFMGELMAQLLSREAAFPL